MKPESVSISVVIPNYNGQSLLEANLPLVYQALESSGIETYEVIVADDASQDGSIEFLKTTYPSIKLVLNTTNTGFSGNTNSGVKVAVHDLVLILNSDVQLSEKFFVPLLPFFKEETTFGVMSKIIGVASDAIQDGAKYPSYSFAAIGSTKNYLIEGNESAYTWFLSGANALVDRKKFMELGGFNEFFNPYYGEDVDLGLNAWRHGFKLYYCGAAYCRHPLSVTINKEPSERVQLTTKRNKIILHFLHLDGFELEVFLLQYRIKAIFRLLSGNSFYWRAFDNFKSLKNGLEQMKRSRQAAGQIRRLKDVQITILQPLQEKKIQKF